MAPNRNAAARNAASKSCAHVPRLRPTGDDGTRPPRTMRRDCR